MSDQDQERQRELLLERAVLYWKKCSTLPMSVFNAAFSNWDSQSNKDAWVEIRREQARLSLEYTADPNKPMVALIKAVSEVLSMAAAIELLDTGGLFTHMPAEVGMVEPEGAAMGPSYEQLLGQEMVKARSAEATAGPLFERIESGEAMTPHAHVASVDVGVVGQALGLTAGQREALTPEGSSIRVDRVDAVLIDLVARYVEGLISEAKLPVVRGGVSRAAAVNIAVAAVLSAAELPGIVLDEAGEVMVELVSRSGDLRRSLSVDANLAAIGNELENLRKVAVGARAAAIRAEVNSLSSGLVSAYTLAERLRLVAPGVEPSLDAIKFDEVGSLYERAQLGADKQRQRELDRAGRSTAGHPDRRKSI